MFTLFAQSMVGHYDEGRLHEWPMEASGFFERTRFASIPDLLQVCPELSYNVRLSSIP